MENWKSIVCQATQMMDKYPEYWGEFNRLNLQEACEFILWQREYNKFDAEPDEFFEHQAECEYGDNGSPELKVIYSRAFKCVHAYELDRGMLKVL